MRAHGQVPQLALDVEHTTDDVQVSRVGIIRLVDLPLPDGANASTCRSRRLASRWSRARACLGARPCQALTTTAGVPTATAAGGSGGSATGAGSSSAPPPLPPAESAPAEPPAAVAPPLPSPPSPAAPAPRCRARVLREEEMREPRPRRSEPSMAGFSGGSGQDP